jgi:hypothetical protein
MEWMVNGLFSKGPTSFCLAHEAMEWEAVSKGWGRGRGRGGGGRRREEEGNKKEVGRGQDGMDGRWLV